MGKWSPEQEFNPHHPQYKRGVLFKLSGQIQTSEFPEVNFSRFVVSLCRLYIREEISKVLVLALKADLRIPLAGFFEEVNTFSSRTSSMLPRLIELVLLFCANTKIRTAIV